MTDDQIEQWKVEREIARAIADPDSRKAALEKVYDHRDEMQMQCIAHQSRRQKEMMDDIAEIKRDHPALVAHLHAEQNAEQQRNGAARLLRWLTAIGIFGGGSTATYLLKELISLLNQ